MFGFLRKVPRNNPPGTPTTPDLRWDLRAHLLPGVDDGVRTLDEALDAIRALLQ